MIVDQFKTNRVRCRCALSKSGCNTCEERGFLYYRIDTEDGFSAELSSVNGTLITGMFEDLDRTPPHRPDTLSRAWWDLKRTSDEIDRSAFVITDRYGEGKTVSIDSDRRLSVRTDEEYDSENLLRIRLLGRIPADVLKFQRWFRVNSWVEPCNHHAFPDVGQMSTVYVDPSKRGW